MLQKQPGSLHTNELFQEEHEQMDTAVHKDVDILLHVYTCAVPGHRVLHTPLGDPTHGQDIDLLSVFPPHCRLTFTKGTITQAQR